MSATLPVVYLARHGETEWSLSGQHTGLTDLPLTVRGRNNARKLGERLGGLAFARVFTSPLQRAMLTCELAGFGRVGTTDRDLVEWNYGRYEGVRTAEIRMERPDWQLFRDGCPGGETHSKSVHEPIGYSEGARATGQCADLFERALPARLHGSLAGTRSGCGGVLCIGHGQPQRTQL